MKPYVYAVFLRLPCESIPPRQCFHFADKRITAREFNAHVQPVRTNPGVRVQYAHTILMTKFMSRALYAVPHVCLQSEVYFGLHSVDAAFALATKCFSGTKAFSYQ